MIPFEKKNILPPHPKIIFPSPEIFFWPDFFKFYFFKINHATSSNLYWFYYLHRLRGLVSPGCEIFCCFLQPIEIICYIFPLTTTLFCNLIRFHTLKKSHIFNVKWWSNGYPSYRYFEITMQWMVLVAANTAQKSSMKKYLTVWRDKISF